MKTARGGASAATSLAGEPALVAPSAARAAIASSARSCTTHWCPPRKRRRTMLPPIRPRPIIPICMGPNLSVRTALLPRQGPAVSEVHAGYNGWRAGTGAAGQEDAMTRTVATALAAPLLWTALAAQAPPAPTGGAGEVQIREWPVPWEASRPRDPYVAPDGKVWFVGQRGDYLAWLDPASGEMKRRDLPAGTGPHNLVVAPDGLVWYAGNRDRKSVV